MSEKIEQLLHQVKTIDDAYKIVKKNTGEDFNLFQILWMETAEVKTHSKFLAELLNPKGSHLQGDIFLKLFVEYLNKESGEEENTFLLNENKININSEKSQVQVEKHIGKITDNEGGRIDITIVDLENRLICIENKIYAGEQDRQLLRYKNFGDKFTECHLLFLTLNGNRCSSLNEEDGIVYSISYKKHIVEWLELCKKEAVNLPILRETIGQYINLIKRLTNQTTNKQMEKDLQKIIIKNYDESLLIYRNFEKSVFNIYNIVIEELSKRINLYLEENFNYWEVSYTGILKSIKDRGNIFIKPKYLANGIGGFGLEEFNPLCRHYHFNHRIFYGIVNWKRDKGFLEFAKNIDTNNVSQDGWINYDFPSSENFDFSQNTEHHIIKIQNIDERLEFIQQLFQNFTRYFEDNQQGYLDYLNCYDLNFEIENFGDNKIIQLANVDKFKLYQFIKSKITKTDFENISNIRIWESNDKNQCCLVVDYPHFRFDLILTNNQFTIEIIHLENSSAKSKILDSNVYNLLKNGRYISIINGDTLNEIIKNLNIRIKEIDDLIK